MHSLVLFSLKVRLTFRTFPFHDTSGKNPGSSLEVSGETTFDQVPNAATIGLGSNTCAIISHRERRESSGAIEIPNYLVTLICADSGGCCLALAQFVSEMDNYHRHLFQCVQGKLLQVIAS